MCAPDAGSIVPANISSTNQTATLLTAPAATAVEPFTGDAEQNELWSLAVLLVVTMMVAFL